MTDYIHEWTPRRSLPNYRHMSCIRCGLRIAYIEEKLRSNPKFKKIHTRHTLILKAFKEEWRYKRYTEYMDKKNELLDAAERDIQAVIGQIQPCLTDDEVMVKDVIE